MNRVFQILEYGEKVPLQFTSKARSSEGVFRSFAKSHSGYLRKDTIYSLYGNIDFGFTKIASAFWNGKSFVEVALKINTTDLFYKFLENNKDFKL